MKKSKVAHERQLIGWREWMSLPELNIPLIKAKMDTGAKTSALHAFMIESFKERRKDKVRFLIHPFQRNTKQVIVCTADVVDMRWVSDSGGHREMRHVIQTLVKLGEHEWPIDITLTNRDSMLFRILVGRTALLNRFIVDPAHSYLVKKRDQHL